MHALLPSILAGLATALGSIVVLIWKHPERRTLAILLGGAAGVMLAVVLLDLIPAALDQGTPLEAGIGFGAGVVFLWGLDKLLTRFTGGNTYSLEASYKRMGYLMATGIAMHDLPEGIAIAGAYAAGGAWGRCWPSPSPCTTSLRASPPPPLCTWEASGAAGCS